jgi:hypothetical protein
MKHQCSGITNKGLQCRRMLYSDRRCYQHQENNTVIVPKKCAKKMCNICTEDRDSGAIQNMKCCGQEMCKVCIRSLETLKCPFCRASLKVSLEHSFYREINEDFNQKRAYSHMISVRQQNRILSRIRSRQQILDMRQILVSIETAPAREYHTLIVLLTNQHVEMISTLELIQNSLIA